MMINNDNLSFIPYAQLMAEGTPYITINLDLADPIELDDFVGFFGAVSDEFERFLRSNYPDAGQQARFFVQEVRKGSIIADLFPGGGADIIQLMDNVLIVTAFADLVGKTILSYIKGGKKEGASKGELQSFLNMVKAVAKDSNGQAVIETAVYEQGLWKKNVAVSFTTAEAREAIKALEHHKADLDKVDRADRTRALMYFKRSDIGDVKLGKPSGERVVIEEISPKDRPLTYASDLAEQRIKHEIRESETNIFKKAFVVDVNIKTKDGKPVAYAVTHVHDVIDLPDED